VTLGLPFREVWLLDTEFIAKPGCLPVPVCLVARELGTGRLIRLWQDELPDKPPFPIDDQSLLVCFYAPAELGFFLQCGWQLPSRVLDLFVEARNATNGAALPERPEHNDLLSVLSYHGISAITAEQKEADRGLIMRGGPWAAAEQKRILDYCQSDTDLLGPLLERMLPAIRARPNGLGQALLRGRYTAAAARMEANGVPVDVELLGRLRERWDLIKQDLIKAVDKDYGVFEGSTFKKGLFAAWCAAERIDWPRTPIGQLSDDKDTWKDMAQLHPQLEPLRDLRKTLAQLRLEKLAVGPDGRNRVMLSPFRAVTGRNQPSNSRSIFGPAKWVRGLIRPGPGRALAYIDWCSQEIWIAAALSGDRALLDAVTSGDPYLGFAKMAHLVPDDATEESHRQQRGLCKTAMLATNYGQGARSLAARTGMTTIEARDLLRRLAQTFPTYTAWAEQVINVAQLTGYLSTVFGWTVRVTGASRSTSLRNWPMQANANEMLRLACCLATERGIQACMPVHDALLVEGPAEEIDDVVVATRAAMGEASRTVLGGLEIPTEVAIVRWPDRYMDEDGQVMWDRVMELL
jgi:DNA polymerase family A